MEAAVSEGGGDSEQAAWLLNEIILRNTQTLPVDSLSPQALDLVRDLLDKSVQHSVYLSNPYGNQIMRGEQTAILKPKEWWGLTSFVGLSSGTKELGFVRFSPGELLTIADVKTRQDEHRMSEADIAKLWPDATALYFYRVRESIPHKQAVEVGSIDARQVIVQRKRSETGPTHLEMEAVIKSTDSVRRVIKCVVLKPESTDLQGEIYSASVVAKASDDFMMKSQVVGYMHKSRALDVAIVENWITDHDETLGGETVNKGTWIMGIKILSDTIWKQIEDGKITGLSIGGWARPEEAVA